MRGMELTFIVVEQGKLLYLRLLIIQGGWQQRGRVLKCSIYGLQKSTPKSKLQNKFT